MIRDRDRYRDSWQILMYLLVCAIPRQTFCYGIALWNCYLPWKQQIYLLVFFGKE